jgi:hypothetical protein
MKMAISREQDPRAYALFSVRNGKYHKPAQPFERPLAWKPTLTVCGRTLTPLNYFVTEADADRHTGHRLSRWLCQRCGEDRPAPEPAPGVAAEVAP